MRMLDFPMRPIRCALVCYSLLLMTVSINCAEKVQTAPIPGPALFPWGESSDTAISRLSAEGWVLSSEASDQVVLSYPVTADPELEDSALFDAGESPEEPYTLRLYFNEKALTIASIMRRGDAETMKLFEASIRELYGLQNPALPATQNSETTETGNLISTSQEIYKSSDYLFKLTRTEIKAAEEELQGGQNDQLELQLFPLEQNEGITAEALTNPGQ
jgi:hypothetical protein